MPRTSPQAASSPVNRSPGARRGAERCAAAEPFVRQPGGERGAADAAFGHVDRQRLAVLVHQVEEMPHFLLDKGGLAGRGRFGRRGTPIDVVGEGVHRIQPALRQHAARPIRRVRREAAAEDHRLRLGPLDRPVGHLEQLGVLLRRAAEKPLPARLVPHLPVADTVAEVFDRLPHVVLPLSDVAGRRSSNCRGPAPAGAAGRPRAAGGRGSPES